VQPLRTLSVVAALAGLFAAPAASAADLLTIFRQAQTSDAAYASARASWQAAQEKLPQGRALLLPSVSASANTNYNERTIDVRGGASSGGRYNSNNLTLSVTQPIYRAQNRIQFEQSKIQVAQADAQLSSALQDLILRVAQAYFDALLAQDNLDLVGAQKAAIAEQLAQAKRNFEVGTATITDTHEAQARFDLATAQEIAARNELEVRRRALEQIVGSAVPPVTPLGSGFRLVSPEPARTEEWVEQSIANSLQVQIQRAAEEFAAKEVERNRAGHHPTVDAVASYTDAGAGSGVQGGAGTDVATKTVGIQVAVPIYQGGAVDSRVREAIANLEKARQDLENARRTVALNARQAFSGVTSGIAQVRALESAVVSSQSQLDSTRLGQEVGVRTGVDVLNAQQQLYSARRDLAQARYNYILNSLRLEAAAGRLDEDDVARINRWLGR